jgi:hypothetical protein
MHGLVGSGRSLSGDVWVRLSANEQSSETELRDVATLHGETERVDILLVLSLGTIEVIDISTQLYIV